ncbi:MAG: 50S ribosomal protein L18 [Candidatus Buchananbacteria bacterium RIFCSPHIGHO2_01_FULL_39_14]|uniref:Large ribosomal subunit protein uL18 n=2 Tax=Candidatus Buchananiibacteriota TaxID=1817903 RepID=A0A1G1YPS4_9BACT|nr:MAG: 50S ribosomal protein L18 [Candidatus Buchananbacteria bacterium RIFCSPHIGHO2_01_FULL_39_14]OGY49323.1 MAG: 50S ribosomal protein L18 [Candidatus Buchananbacteria bacterium RIFCSPHIGHO2_02_FULL_39_17]OGY53640.1 MAG: 50S ribosomal protein L18 [Candidatus Buchananbacteria bacterium RIFCSPLOWO2_01_FULL_40_23b]
MTRHQKIKQEKRLRRKIRTRAKIFGTAKCPRLNVFRSLNHLYVQLIDDQLGVTLVAASDQEINNQKMTKSQKALETGKLIAQKAQKLGVIQVVFDKSSYQYHGRVQAVADGARAGGLKF